MTRMTRMTRTTHLVSMAAALLVALSGCSSLAPRHDRPALPVAAAYPGAVNSTTPSPAAADIDWRSFFADPKPRRLIEMALANNRDLRVAVLNIEQARASTLTLRQQQSSVDTARVESGALHQPGGARSERAHFACWGIGA